MSWALPAVGADRRRGRRASDLAPAGHSDGFIQALFSGGDSRIATNPLTGLNKYLCPPMPAPEGVWAASCTASPIAPRSLHAAAEAFSEMARMPSPRRKSERLNDLTGEIEARLARYFGVGALARAILCPSGTDALLTAALMIASERPGEPITAILPSATETGTGVPLASVGRLFDGPRTGGSMAGGGGTTVEVPLRSADGSPYSESAVNDAFAAAAAAAKGNMIVTLTHGTKTGLIAPVSPPGNVEVIVDACQARIEPKSVAAYVRRGWPVVVTGSKFFGGPAFSGAVLFPHARKPPGGRSPLSSDRPGSATLGTALRWTAALAIIDAFVPLAGGMADILSRRAAFIARAFASNQALVPVAGLLPRGPGWADLPSIFTFGVRDPAERGRLLSAGELRPLYERLARGGVLLGQPVGLGSFGGLRLAIGARDLLDEASDDGPERVFAALEEMTAQSRR